jgi:hypothetical protein
LSTAACALASGSVETIKYDPKVFGFSTDPRCRGELRPERRVVERPVYGMLVVGRDNSLRRDEMPPGRSAVFLDDRLSSHRQEPVGTLLLLAFLF